MFCYQAGICVGWYNQNGPGEIVSAGVDKPGEKTNGLGFNHNKTFKTQKAAKEWITTQLTESEYRDNDN